MDHEIRYCLTWPGADQTTIRALYGVLIAQSIRLQRRCFEIRRRRPECENDTMTHDVSEQRATRRRRTGAGEPRHDFVKKKVTAIQNLNGIMAIMAGIIRIIRQLER